MTMTTNTIPVRASDRLQTLFARDERLIDVIAAHSPKLAKLRDSPMRRVMARVTTVAQAARLCNVPVDALLRDLNQILGIDTDDIQPGAPAVVDQPPVGSEAYTPVPSFAESVELDVRDELASGGEPFSRIMAAVASLGQGEVLHLRAPFEPVPLFAVMAKRGFGHSVTQHGPDDWSVWFFRSDTPEAQFKSNEPASTASAATPVATQVGGDDADDKDDEEIARPEIWLDVRDMEPPEPLVRTLEALTALPTDAVLVQRNVRVPQFLLPVLRERGFHFAIDESQPNEVQVRIWRST